MWTDEHTGMGLGKMPYYFFFWTDEIIQHLVEHGVSQEDFERVVSHPLDVGRSRSSDLPSAFGYTEDGRYIIAIYDFLEDATILPITAYEVPEPNQRCVMEKARIKGRIHGTLTAAQRRRVQKVRSLVKKELPDLLRRNQRAREVRKERTFSGALRRAIHAFPQSPMKIAASAGIEWADLDDFLTGEKALTSDAIDRLVKVLRLRMPARNTRAAKAS